MQKVVVVEEETVEAEAKEKTAKKSAKKESSQSVFETLSKINVNEHTEKKPSGSKELTYLSWTWAFDVISRFDPDWKYHVVEFDDNGIEVQEGEHGHQYQKVLGGYMVHTDVTVKGVTKRMFLPIMDSHNAAMKDEPYKVTVGNKYGKTYEYVVPAVDAMALNKTIMRCVVKCLAQFGLGLYIFAGEDLPATDEEVVIEGKVEDGKVKAEAKEPEKPMTFAEALTHKFEGGGVLKGTLMLELITGTEEKPIKDPEKAKNLLKSFSTNGIGKDKECATLLLKGLEDGEIHFNEPTNE